jgi:two-component system sensor histidine kinase KdpD
VLNQARSWIPRPHRPPLAGLALAAIGLAVSTALAFVLVRQLAVPDAAIVYLLPVVGVGMAYGSWLAIGTSIASFLIYDFCFVKPLYTFSIDSSEEWLDLLLFLVVAIAIGRLSALQLQRRREAELRTAEARAMFVISRDIANATALLEAAPMAATRLAREAEMSRVWVGLGGAPSEERVVADSRPADPRPSTASRWVLHSTSAEAQPSWARVHDPIMARPRSRDAGAREAAAVTAREAAGSTADRETPDADAAERRRDQTPTVFRVPIQGGGDTIGSLWATRAPGAPFPGRSHSRLMAATADQLGQAVVRDRLAAEATAAEVARQGDALKSALLDSVSHDLRTPLAAIRAAAGNLMDPQVDLSRDEARATARSIDLEAQRLSRLVRNMLDLSRIEGGALHPSLELYNLADLVDPVVERLGPALAPSEVEVDMPEDLPAVEVDALFVDQIVTNLLENAARYAPGKQIRVSATDSDDRVELVVEDAGPGVPAAQLPRLFERFYRAPRRQGSRSEGGSGIGLTVVQGLAEAMGGSVEARPSSMGGLAIAVRLDCVSVVEPEPGAEPKPEPGPDQPADTNGRAPETAAQPSARPR